MPFLWELEQSEIQTASSRIWTRVANSNDDNRYTKVSSCFIIIIKRISEVPVV